MALLYHSQTNTRIWPCASLTGLSGCENFCEKAASPGVEMQFCLLSSLLNPQFWASGNLTEGTAAAEQGKEREEATKPKTKSLKSLVPLEEVCVPMKGCYCCNYSCACCHWEWMCPPCSRGCRQGGNILLPQLSQPGHGAIHPLLPARPGVSLAKSWRETKLTDADLH